MELPIISQNIDTNIQIDFVSIHIMDAMKYKS